nr:hypothetical protein CJLB15_00071 [Campylobacter phage CJLB-15]
MFSISYIWWRTVFNPDIVYYIFDLTDKIILKKFNLSLIIMVF